jgi:protein TonB
MDLNKIKTADLNDIVFEGRNKVYGAYFLRRVYDKHVIRGFIISILTFVICLGGPVIWEKIKPTAEVEKPKVSLVDLANIKPPPPVDPKTPPPPPPPPPPPLKATIKFTPPVIKKDEEVHEDPPKQEEIQKVVISDKTQEGNKDGIDQLEIDPNIGKEVDAKPTIFTFVEQMPSFPGGEEKMGEFIGENLKYPSRARDNQTEGKVVLTFVVNETGGISDIKVLRDIGDGCGQAAIDVIKKMKPWSPGKQNGKAVPVQFTLPIQFSLQ